jgi:hypothetical protein
MTFRVAFTIAVHGNRTADGAWMAEMKAMRPGRPTPAIHGQTVTLIGGPCDGDVLKDVTIGTIEVAAEAEPGLIGCGTYRRVSDHRARWVGWWHTWGVS